MNSSTLTQATTLFSSQPPWISYLVLVVTSTSLVYLVHRSQARSTAPLPPGPKPLPVIGNLLHIPTRHPWKVYNEWRKEYGDIIHLNALGQHIVVVNSLEDAQELLVARASNYSDRPQTPVVDLTHLRYAMSMMNYGAEWREHRGVFHRALSHTQVHKFRPVIEQEMRKFLPRLLADPGDHRELLRHLLAAIIMRVSYGSEDYEHNKHLAHSAAAVVEGFLKYSDPARLLVNVFPSLRFAPAWFPGAGWKHLLAEVAAHSDAARDVPFDEVKMRMRSGTQTDCGALAVQFLEGLPPKGAPDYERQEQNARSACANAYIGGADTSVSTAIAMVLALAMNLRVQRRAQEELDTVVGSLQIPTAEDIVHLPYIQAIVKEVFRWHTVLPLCVPRVARHEDVYKGYRIPANSIIMPNQWAMMHDPTYFADPHDFRPERFIKDGKIDGSVLDADAAAFGFGRRICPGRDFSKDNLLILTAMLLACFDIERALDEHGEPIPLELEEPHIMISTPLPYECNFKPRSQQHAELIRSCEA